MRGVPIPQRTARFHIEQFGRHAQFFTKGGDTDDEHGRNRNGTARFNRVSFETHVGPIEPASVEFMLHIFTDDGAIALFQQLVSIEICNLVLDHLTVDVTHDIDDSDVVNAQESALDLALSPQQKVAGLRH